MIVRLNHQGWTAAGARCRAKRRSPHHGRSQLIKMRAKPGSAGVIFRPQRSSGLLPTLDRLLTSRGPGEEHCYVCPAGAAVLEGGGG